MQYSGIIAIILSVILSLQTHAPTPRDVQETRAIVELTERQEKAFRAELQQTYPDYTLRVINADLGFFKLSIRNTGSRSVTSFLDLCRERDILTQWQEDKKVQLRTVPDDPLWGEQWNLMRIGAEEAWERQTGGITSYSDTIVVAILDAGFDIDHPDLTEAFWRNRQEIPEDGIDNDDNGYTDDHTGLNIETGKDDHPVNTHGTSVAGIIGAAGNNGEGIAGINWNVKILPISGIQTESEIIEGYAYVKALRERYNTTSGQEGAFIVATNLSAGIDGEFAKDHPMWCAAYDDMGSVGVLSVAATTNRNTNVDTDGDMPSTCTSNFLITVTMTNMQDEKHLFAGYGSQHVDIGAPGTSLLTTDVGGMYENFDGTSAAAPHVTGAIGLLCAGKCTVFGALMRTEPAAAASLVRSVLIESVDRNAALEEQVASGGRLNLNKAMTHIEDECGTFGDPLEILSVFPNPARDYLQVTYNTPDFSQYTFRVIDLLGREVRSEYVHPGSLGTKLYALDASVLIPGPYFLTLSGKGKSETVVFVVQ